MDVIKKIESLLDWEEQSCNWYAGEYTDKSQPLAKAAELIGATYVAVEIYEGFSFPYPAFKRDGKIAFLDVRADKPALQPTILELLEDLKA